MTPSQSKRSALLSHFLLWTVFTVVLWSYYVLAHDKESAPLYSAFRVLLKTGLLSAFFYLHAGVLIPRLLALRRFALYLACLVGCFAGYIGHDLLALYLGGAKRLGAESWLDLQPFVLDDVLAFLLILAISGGHALTTRWLESEAAREAAEKEQAQAELAVLKAQVNPHFLFNTLNNVRALARREHAEQTEEALLQLSQIMRYMLHDASAPRVALEKEIRYLEDLAALHQLRLPPGMTLSFEVEGDPSGIYVAPMLFTPLVENAFKHGVSSRDGGFIRLHLTAGQGTTGQGTTGQGTAGQGVPAGDGMAPPGASRSAEGLRFEAVNTKREAKTPSPVEHSFDKRSSEERSAIGLSNLRRRLALLYPGHHALRIEDGEVAFRVVLSLDATHGPFAAEFAAEEAAGFEKVEHRKSAASGNGRTRSGSDSPSPIEETTP